MAMQIITTVSNVMVAVLFVYFSWILFCDIVALFCKKKRYGSAEPSNIAVVICARNEANVIGNLLDSLMKQNYPKDKLRVFVVAHNCTDNTAEVARIHGAEVFMRNEPSEKFKGQALHYGVKRIMAEYPGQFEILSVFDADNVAGRDFMSEINACIRSGADMAQGFRNSKNYHATVVSELFGAYWYQIMICQNLPHSAMHLPVTIGGTGFAVKMDALDEDGWHTFTMLEDIEFTCQMALKGKICRLAPHAMFYDEQPLDWKTGFKQRYRWSLGGYQVLGIYLPKLARVVPKYGAKALKMMFDLLINPVLLISLAGMIIQGAIIGMTSGVVPVLLYILKMIGMCWVTVFPVTMILFIKQRLNPFKNLATVFVFPYFLLLSMVFAVPALFDRNPKWEPIPHCSTETIEQLEGGSDDEENDGR